LSESALDRTARALDLIPYLLEHQGISIAELAQVFGTTEKQINDDLILIHMCGLPGYTPLELIEMYYEDGYVTVSDPQSLKKPRQMNRSEVTSLLVSLDLLKSLRTDEIAIEIEALKNKLLRSLSYEIPYVVVTDAKNPEIVEILEKAITRASALRIKYLSGVKDEISEREIQPLEIYQANNQTYLSAWCQRSAGDRTFRVDRIQAVEVIEGRTIKYAPTIVISENQNPVIELLVTKGARQFIEDNRAVIASVEDGDSATVKIQAIDEEWLIRTVIGYGGNIQILTPAKLADEVKKRAQEISALY
jgi:proteasome accessory factor C